MQGSRARVAARAGEPLLDIRFIRAHPDAVRHAARLKRLDVAVDRIRALDAERRRRIQASDELKAKQNRTSKQIATLEG
jgi:seryl-tRNA synthetase